MRRVTKENLIAQIDRLYKMKDEQGQLSMNGEYTLQTYKMLLATMLEWIPVSEQMPKNKPGSYEYLVFETLNNRVQHDYWNSEGEYSNLESFWNHYGNYVTHWMPLPTFNQK